jgi:putative salt-induced outer membrane protein
MFAKTTWLTVAFAAFPSIACAAAAPDSSEVPSAAGDAASTASTAALDPGIRKMIETAIATGDPATVASVLAVARQAAPEAKDGIDEQEKAWRTQLAAKTAKAHEEQLARLRTASPLENWKGEVEVGASRSTGSTTSFGLLGALDLKREGVDWTHKLSARADVQSTNGQTTTERIFAAWQPNYRFQEKTYAYGLAQFEHDPFAGYDSRYTLGGGLGYQALDGARLKLSLEGGPAVRRIDEVHGGIHSRIAGRGSLNLNWRVTPTLSLTQNTAVYLEGADGNVVANTALDTKLIGNLKARFSYNVQYERNPPVGSSELNTQSRATFVYSF